MVKQQDLERSSIGHRRTLLWAGGAALLLVPFLLRLLTGNPPWGAIDLLLLAVLIFLPIFLYDASTSRMTSRLSKVAIATALLNGAFLVWGVLSMGVIGDTDHPANLLYAAVIASALAGGYVARLDPAQMKRAMLATAAVQCAVTVIALVGQLGQPANEPLELLGLSGFFVIMWLISATLFDRASRVQRHKACQEVSDA